MVSGYNVAPAATGLDCGTGPSSYMLSPRRTRPGLSIRAEAMRARWSKLVPSFMVIAATRRNQRLRLNYFMKAMPPWIWLDMRPSAIHLSLQNAFAWDTSTLAGRPWSIRHSAS